MKTVLYINGVDDVGKRLVNIIHSKVPEMQAKICNSIEHISQILRQPLNNVSIMVLLVSSRDELIQFNLMNPLFDNIKVILILTDRQKELLELGHKLKPSFISDVNSDLQDVVSVLRQIKKKENK